MQYHANLINIKVYENLLCTAICSSGAVPIAHHIADQ